MISDFFANSQDNMQKEWTVAPIDSGMKLQAFLAAKIGHSAKSLKKAIEANCCQINGRTERFASTIVGLGDRIYLDIKERPSLEFDNSRLLYEDDDLLVYNKPAGINCDEDGILKLLRKHNANLQLVHRLDRDTTGTLILSKNEETLKHLIGQFKYHEVKKSYRAIVDGVIKKQSGKIENYLVVKRKIAGQTIWGESDQPPGLHAVTRWESLKKGKETSLVVCYPETGKTHQLRVHLAGMGHPILGDVQYGKKFKTTYHADRYLLHSDQIAFSHPKTMKKIVATAPFPDDFKDAERNLFT